MATVALAMVGSALGGAALPASMSLFGSTITGAALGQAIGGAIGGMIDQALFGPKPPDTEGPRLESSTFSNVDEGAPIPRVYGVHRTSCSLVWATRFREVAKQESAGGKGIGGGGSHTSYTYFVSLAVVVSEGASRVKRIFFDGQDVGPLTEVLTEHGATITAKDGTIRATFYDGTQTEPDALIEAVEGDAPSYRGVAYLVFEELNLTDGLGNRLPNISAEVERDIPAATVRGLLQAVGADYGVSLNASAAPDAPIVGLLIERPMSARQAIEGASGLHQLVLTFADDGGLRVAPMQGEPILMISEDELAEGDQGGAPLAIRRARPDDAPGEISLSYADPDRDFQPAEVIARRRIRQVENPERLQTALALSRAEAMSLAHSALETAAAGRETASGVFAPRHARLLRPADVVEITARSGRKRRVRLTRLAWEWRAPFEGVVTAQAPPRAQISGGNGALTDPVSGYGPVDLVFLDLPLLRGDEPPHAPHVAAWAAPWAGATLYRASPGGGYVEAAILRERATMGALEAALPPAAPWVWDAGAELTVKLKPGGLLSSATLEAVEAGANAAALEWPGGWEIVQWREAELVSPGLWRLSHLRRGMRGTEHLISGAAPAGARFVRLNGALVQPDLPPTLRAQPQSWLWGPSNIPAGAPSGPVVRYTATAAANEFPAVPLLPLVRLSGQVGTMAARPGAVFVLSAWFHNAGAAGSMGFRYGFLPASNAWGGANPAVSSAVRGEWVRLEARIVFGLDADLSAFRAFLRFTGLPEGAHGYVAGVSLRQVSGWRAAESIQQAADSRAPALRSYTVTTLPSASPAMQTAYVSNGASNKRLAISDGSVWRWPDGAVVS